MSGVKILQGDGVVDNTCITLRMQETMVCAVGCSRIHFVEVAVKLWLDENDAIEELLHHGLLILLVHCCDGLKLEVSLPIDGCLRN